MPYSLKTIVKHSNVIIKSSRVQGLVGTHVFHRPACLCCLLQLIQVVKGLVWWQQSIQLPTSAAVKRTLKTKCGMSIKATLCSACACVVLLRKTVLSGEDTNREPGDQKKKNENKRMPVFCAKCCKGHAADVNLCLNNLLKMLKILKHFKYFFL